MSAPAPAAPRHAFLPYAIALDLVIVAVGIALLLPPDSGLTLVPFIVVVGLITSRYDWKAGLATTAFSLAGLLLTFGALPKEQLILFALIGVAASAFLDAPRAQVPTADQLRDALVLHETVAPLRRHVADALMYLGLPVLVAVVFLNLSTVLVENIGIPSILQPLVLVLGGLALLHRHELRASSLVMPMTIALAAYVLIVFTSSNWARNGADADRDLIDLTKSVMLLLVVGATAASWRALRRGLVALTAAALLLSVLTLIQVAIGDPTLRFGGLAEADQGHIFGEVMQLRPAGPVSDANYLARILILAVSAAAFLGIGRKSRLEQTFWIGAAGVIGLAVIFTYSRGGMLSLAAVGLLLVLAGRIRITPVTLGLGLAALLVIAPTNAGKRLLTLESLFGNKSELTAAGDASLDKRRQLLAIGARIFDDHPFGGVGVGNFGSHFPAYANLVGLTSIDYTPMGHRQFPHNLYLEILTETGAVGLGAFVIAIAVTLASLLSARRKLLARGEETNAALVTAVAIGIAGYVLASLFLHSGLHRYLWMFLGFAVAAVRLTNEDVSPAPAE